ncbi:ROK family protein [Pseudoalteromonas sp. JBTF-M23]|uniref:ROK family protein n=1 Tax=Pseudoalteromonas caenipelagi TaxID=2726988 RepID=A0A849VHS7_9GAMM|nr:ROK family protein [Pseudoalteromonas caenipelagi]NOU52258.1 ROK family protein [Pseudoalteromonas caenipelagi]
MNHSLLCIDLGGTKAQVASVTHSQVKQVRQYAVPSQASLSQVNAFVMRLIDENRTLETTGIAIGVPSTLEVCSGTVLTTQNIPHWHNVPLKHLLEQRFSLPVVVHNDANCFVYGEYLYGGHDAKNLIGVCLGTGIGAGFVFNGSLYTGNHSAAGELGNLTYLDGIIEDYASGQFFGRQGIEGKWLAEQAQYGDSFALQQFETFGSHVGHALAQVVLVLNPDVIVLGGSVTHSYDYFKAALDAKMLQLLDGALYQSVSVMPSTLNHAPLLGAYGLFQHNKINYDNKELANEV